MDWTQDMLLALKGELPAHRQEALDAALAQDDALRAEWEALRRTQALLETQRFRVQPYLATRVMARLEQATPRWGTAFRRVVMPVLAAILVLLILTYVQEDGLNFSTLAGLAPLDVETVAVAEWSGLDW